MRRVDWMSDVTGRSPQSVWREYKKAEQRHADRREEEVRTGQPQPRIKPWTPQPGSVQPRRASSMPSPATTRPSTCPAGTPQARNPPTPGTTTLSSTPRRIAVPTRTPLARPAPTPRPKPCPPLRHLPSPGATRHPDRGGEWTPARERLWHEVQAAWAAAIRRLGWRDSKRIGKAPTPRFNPTPRSATCAAPFGNSAARRDSIFERKLRAYRKSQEWRFTTSLPQRAKLHRHLKAGLEHEFSQSIGAYLRHLDERLASSRRSPHRRAKKG